MDYIDTLQKKPLHIRRRILAIGAIGTTLLIGFAWIFVIMNSLGRTTPIPTPAVSNEVKSSSPFALLKDSALRIVGRINYESSNTTSTIPSSSNDATVSSGTPLADPNAVYTSNP